MKLYKSWMSYVILGTWGLSSLSFFSKSPLLVVRGVGPTRRLQRQHGHFGVRVDEVVQVLDVVRDLGHLGVELLELLLEEPAEPVQGSGNRLEVEVRPGAGVWARLEQYYGVLVPLFVA